MKRGSLLIGAVIFAHFAFATPPNTPILDGRPLEYDAADLRGTYTGGGGAFGPGVGITNLYVTWDTNYLYIALQGEEVNDKLVVMVDVDPTNGTGATSTTNWTGVLPDFIRYNDVGWRKSDALDAVDFGLDLMIASEGFFNNINQIFYDGEAAPTTNNVKSLFDSGNGNTPVGSPVDMAVQSDTSINELKGLEARIPWSVVYGSNRFGTVQSGEIVPRGAVLRLFANIHNNDPTSAYSANDAIPRQTSPNASYAGGLLITDDYLDVTVDGNDDGIPDLVGGGDVNAPFIRFLQGAQGRREVFALFNEPLNESTATTMANWDVGGNTPGAAVMAQTNGVLLQLTNDLPNSPDLVRVTATGVEDTSGNTRSVHNYFSPAAGGLSTSLTVRFILETASGLGLNPGAGAFFINGGVLPLEFGYPPAMSSPMDVYSGTLYYRDVVFPPGTPTTVNYKYSGVLTPTGTNTYEAVRLTDYASAARRLTLDTNVTFMVVTDYLGAAAAPYRDPNTNTGHNALFADPRRGDAGVRDRTTILFQLDLRNYNLAGVSRVLVQGSDPLRGFNLNNESPQVSDFATAPGMSWTTAGLTLYDNGTQGDTNANDGIFSRQWVFSTDGTDADFEPTYPNSLVGRGEFDSPYFGDSFWTDRRSPRSFIYKYYVYLSSGTALDNVGGNIEYYIEGSPTNIVLPHYVWNNTALPPPPPSNSPAMSGLRLTNNNILVLFTNLPSETQHGLHLTTDLLGPWLDYGHRGAGSSGNWTATVQNVTNSLEVYRVFAGPARPQRRAWWTPNPIPNTGATLSVYYTQHGRNLAGQRDVRWFGRILNTGPFTNKIPMTFTNDGGWRVQIPVPPGTNESVQFLFTDPAPSIFDKSYNDKDFYINIGGRASWTPEMPTQGGPFTVTYNAFGGPLATATQVLFHHGFDNFQGVTTPKMTNLIEPTVPGIWTITINLPAGRTNAVDWVFQNGAGTFDNNSTFDWRAFIEQP